MYILDYNKYYKKRINYISIAFLLMLVYIILNNLILWNKNNIIIDFVFIILGVLVYFKIISKLVKISKKVRDMKWLANNGKRIKFTKFKIKESRPYKSEYVKDYIEAKVEVEYENDLGKKILLTSSDFLMLDENLIKQEYQIIYLLIDPNDITKYYISPFIKTKEEKDESNKFINKLMKEIKNNNEDSLKEMIKEESPNIRENDLDKNFWKNNSPIDKK